MPDPTRATHAPSSRVVVVTGAGSGIGRAMTLRLLAGGHRVVLAGRRLDRLQETLSSFVASTADGRAPGEGLVLGTDVTQPDEVDHLVMACVERFGRLDVVVNNAGTMAFGGAVDELEPDDWRAAVEVNLTGSFLVARAAYRQMRQQHPQGGRIINNGSISAQVPRPRSVAYTTTKHAITGLTRSIELDGRAHQIRCTQLDIGNAATEMTTGLAQGALQPDGTTRPEPTFDPGHVADLTAYLVELPLSVTVPFVTISASGMPYLGRG